MERSALPKGIAGTWRSAAKSTNETAQSHLAFNFNEARRPISACDSVSGSLRPTDFRLPITHFFSILRRHSRCFIAVARNKPPGLDSVEQQERQFLVALPTRLGCLRL